MIEEQCCADGREIDSNDGSAVVEKQFHEVVAVFLEGNLKGRGERGLGPFGVLEEFCDDAVETGLRGCEEEILPGVGSFGGTQAIARLDPILKREEFVPF